ncbi:MAG: hypothetical protein QN178_13985 [Armatimonadota bacterium]|nr:hypothetical protein [Armatimonadota bacterium]
MSGHSLPPDEPRPPEACGACGATDAFEGPWMGTWFCNNCGRSVDRDGRPITTWAQQVTPRDRWMKNYGD